MQKGRLYSLRAPDGSLAATALRSSGQVVHAREHHNARLGPEAQWHFEDFAGRIGSEIVPDELRFCRCEGLPAKSVSRLVLHGGFGPEEACQFAEALDGRRNDLDKVGIAPLVELDALEVEIVALVSTAESLCEGAPDLDTTMVEREGGVAQPQFCPLGCGPVCDRGQMSRTRRQERERPQLRRRSY